MVELARKQIGVNLDDNDMNSLNDNFKELYDENGKPITSNKLGDGSVTNDKLGTRSVTWDKLDEGAVTYTRIADKAVRSEKIDESAVTSSKLSKEAVTEDKLAYRAVGSYAIKDNAIVSQKIASGAVGNRILADDSVWTRNLLDGSVTNEKVESVLYGRKIETLMNANDIVKPGTHIITNGNNAPENYNFPPGNEFGIMEVRDMGNNSLAQVYTQPLSGKEYSRRRYNSSWSEWRIINGSANTKMLNKLDLNDITSSGILRQVKSTYVSSELNYPSISGESLIGTLFVSNASGSISQMYIAERAGEIFVRDRNIAGRWFEWKKVSGTNEGNEASGNSIPKTDMEITGRWTSNDAGDNFMFEIGKHELVEIIEAGRSVRDRPIYAAVIGDPTKPAYYINAAAHGTEVGAAEAAWLLVREFTQEESLMFMDMCVIILPNLNPDNRFIARGNKNAVDINRDWVDQKQPETHAAMHILNNYNVVAATDLHNFGYPRHVSLKEAMYGTPEVMAKSQELFDLVTATLENDDQLVRRYDPDAPNSSFTNGVAEQWNVATLLIEIPCGGYNDWTFDHYYPTPYWQAYVGGLACKATAKYVWKNLPDFEALKSN